MPAQIENSVAIVRRMSVSQAEQPQFRHNSHAEMSLRCLLLQQWMYSPGPQQNFHGTATGEQ